MLPFLNFFQNHFAGKFKLGSVHEFGRFVIFKHDIPNPNLIYFFENFHLQNTLKKK